MTFLEHKVDNTPRTPLNGGEDVVFPPLRGDKGGCKQYFQRTVLLLLLVLFFFVSGGKYFVAQAQDPDPDIPAATAQITQKEQHEVKKGFWEKFKAILWRSTTVAAKNALKTFLTQMAYDAAVYLASGADEKPIAWETGFGSYVENVATSAGTDALQTFAQDFLGFDICNPDIKLKLAFVVGVGREQRPRKPKCEWSKISENWDKITNEKDWSDKLALSLEPQQNDIGIGLSMYQSIFNEQSKAEEDATFTRLLTGSFKDGVDVVTKRIEAPFEGASNLYKTTIEKMDKAETTFFGDIVVDTVTVFTNTLFAKGMENLIKRLLEKDVEEEEPSDDFDFDSDPDPPDSELFNPEGDATAEEGGRQAAEARFAELKKVDYQAPTNLDLLTEFEQCPTPIASLNNCTIDTKFSQAIREKLTLQEAMNKGLLHPEWPFGFNNFSGGADLTKNGQPRATEGYAYNAIKRLRLYRVVPLGWEIAAEKIGTQLKRVTTLREVVEGFNTSEGVFYHLVDPNWILKIPPQECLLKGASSALQAFNTRVEYCADVRTCLKEGPDGNCETKFGYCTREQNIWQVSKDTCPSYYDSCKVFTKTSDNKAYPLLQYTVDADSCTANNVGCQWHSMTKDEDGGWNEEPTQENRTYFSRNVEQCDMESDGCSLFVRNQNASGTNLVQDGSFEKVIGRDLEPLDIGDEAVTGFFLGWAWGEYDPVGVIGDGTIGAYATNDAIAGNVAFQPRSIWFPEPPEWPIKGLHPREMIDTGYPLAERIFTLSFYAKNCKEYNGDTGEGSYFKILGGTTQAIHDTSEWQGYTTSLYFPKGTGQRTITFDIYGEHADEPNGRLCTLDAVQLEEGAFVTAYKDYGLVNQLGLKRPPAYLNCVGTAFDAPACYNYAKVCAETEVGCNLFTPESYQGAPISGIAKGSDMCPEACVGYRTYKQSFNYFESQKFPVHFLAETAEECSAVEEGCSEFTNLDELKQTGAERREYYQQLQQCRRPDDPGVEQGVYYTWEGSERTGYNLQTYRLVSRMGLYPGEVNAPNEEESAHPPAYIADRGVEGGFREATQLIDELITQCNKNTYDAKTAPFECLKFYDVEGEVAYRMVSYLIVISDDCYPMRKTRYITSQEECNIYDGGLWFGTHCNIEENDCDVSGGVWDNAQVACIYQAVPAQSAQCDAKMSGCREYRGNLSYTTREAFSQNFEEEPDIAEWRGNFEISSEAPIAGQHALKVNGIQQLRIPVTEALDKEESEVNDMYLLSFTLKGRGNLKIYFDNTAGVSIPMDINKSFSNGQLALTNDWRTVTLGPVMIDETIGPLTEGNFTDKVDLIFELVPNANEPFFLDDILLKETTDTFYLVRESWKTPEICDKNPSGVPSPQYYLGCETYTTVQDETRNLKSFTNICASDKAGCEAVIDTRNSTSPWNATYNALCELSRGICSDDPAAECRSDTDCISEQSPSSFCVFCNDPNGCACTVGGSKECDVKKGQRTCRYIQPYRDVAQANQDESTEVVSEDVIAYLVNTPEMGCDASAKGCTMMGLPEISLAEEGIEQVNGFSDVLKRDDPDKYAQILCSEDFQGCEEYSHGSERYYFKDPRDRVCERKTLTGSKEEKWYQKYKRCQGGSVDESVCYGREEEDQCIQGGGTCEWEECTQIEDFSSFRDVPKESGICVTPGGEEQSNLRTCTSDLDCDPGDVCERSWAYACRAKYDNCTAFVDGVDGMHYYNLDNNAVDKSSCQGLVSQKEGCVLLSNSNVMETQKGPVLNLYSSIATYQLSEGQKNSLVSPVDCELAENRGLCLLPSIGNYVKRGVCQGGGNNGQQCINNGDCVQGVCVVGDWGVCRGATKVVDEEVVQDDAINGKSCSAGNRTCGNGYCSLKNDSNEIIKVRRDRRCGEWLDCLSETRTEGTEREGSGIEQSTCAALFRCRGSTPMNPFLCTDIVTRYCAVSADCHSTFGPLSACVNNQCRIYPLTALIYSQRDVSWAGMDYSGYSLLGQYPMDEFRDLEVGRCERNGSISLNQFCVTAANCFDGYTCNTSKKENRLIFVADDNRLYGVDGHIAAPATSHENDIVPSLVPASCRLFPEDDAPFDKSATDQKYKDVYRCYDDGTDNEDIDASWSCECSYTKLDAGGMRVYVGKNISLLQTGVCVTTSPEKKDMLGKLCNSALECGGDENGSECQIFGEEEIIYGMQGYCLQKDFAWPINGVNNPEDFACLTWFPVGSVGGLDMSLFAPEAGYTAPSNRQDYCVGKVQNSAQYTYRILPWFEGPPSGLEVGGAPDNPYLFSRYSGSNVACNEGTQSHPTYCSPVCGVNTPDQDTRAELCYAPHEGPIGCYELIGGVRARRSFRWEGPSVYQHATRAIRLILGDARWFMLGADANPDTGYNGMDGAVCVDEIDTSDSPDMSESHLWTAGVTWRSFTRLGPSMPNTVLGSWFELPWNRYECGSDVGCIDIYFDRTYNDPLNPACPNNLPYDDDVWDSDYDDNCQVDIGSPSANNRVRFQADWRQLDAECDPATQECVRELALINLEFLGHEGSDPVDYPQGNSRAVEVIGIEIYPKDMCSATIAVINDNASIGSNTKAWTNRVWNDGRREVIPDRSPEWKQYGQQCAPFGAIPLTPYPNGENPTIQYREGAATGENLCMENIARLLWGNKDGGNRWDGNRGIDEGATSIFSIFGSVTEKYGLFFNDAHDGDGDNVRYKDLFYMTPMMDATTVDRTYDMAFEAAMDGPRVHALNTTNGNSMGEAQTISLNGGIGADGTVNIVGEQVLPVEMQFYFYDPSNNQMPIREITVDWGTGTEEGRVKFQGSYKNMMGENDCNGGSFGRTEDACVPRSFRISYLYSCEGEWSPGWGWYGQAGRCAFRPRVRVKNNWGWTNVADYRTGDGDDPWQDIQSPQWDTDFKQQGCYDLIPEEEADGARSEGCYCGAQSGIGVNACEGENGEDWRAWTYYEGLVIVKPPQQ